MTRRIYPVVSVIYRSHLIHVEVEFKLSLAPLSRLELIFEPSGQELTQYLNSTSVAFAAPARWARTPHNQHCLLHNLHGELDGDNTRAI
jgi:hypothetical protein